MKQLNYKQKELFNKLILAKKNNETDKISAIMEEMINIRDNEITEGVFELRYLLDHKLTIEEFKKYGLDPNGISLELSYQETYPGGYAFGGEDLGNIFSYPTFTQVLNFRFRPYDIFKHFSDELIDYLIKHEYLITVNRYSNEEIYLKDLLKNNRDYSYFAEIDEDS